MKKKDMRGAPTPGNTKIDDEFSAGDIVTYSFEFSEAQRGDYIFEKCEGEVKPVALPTVTAAELANEKIFSELQAKFARLQVSKTEQTKKPPTPASVASTNLKALNESIKRIARYTTKRKYEERIGIVTTIIQEKELLISSFKKVLVSTTLSLSSATTITAKAEEIGRANTIKFLLPTLDIISKDIAEIKSLMLPQLITVAKYISQIPEGYEKITSVMLPIVQNLLMDPVLEISEQAAVSLANIAELLTNDDRGNFILTIVLQYSG